MRWVTRFPRTACVNDVSVKDEVLCHGQPRVLREMSLETLASLLKPCQRAMICM